MTLIKCLLASAGLAALAACGTADDTTVENVDANMMVEDNLVLPPDDMNMDANMDMNLGNDTNMADNATSNATDNTVNAY